MALPAAADVLPVGDFQIYLLATCMPLFGEGAQRGRLQGGPGGIRGDHHWTMLQVHCHLAHVDEDSIMNGYVPGSRVRVNLVIEYVADKKSGHNVVCFIKHVSALTPLVNEYSKWLASVGRYDEAVAIVESIERAHGLEPYDPKSEMESAEPLPPAPPHHKQDLVAQERDISAFIFKQIHEKDEALIPLMLEWLLLESEQLRTQKQIQEHLAGPRDEGTRAASLVSSYA
ncbi:hypothetical protein PR002_g27591 [Phytophthora rubi]|uniref:Uncharacterized protein n=2 Tax=Phytophthora TaxID=4783 RepID=A0A6A3HFQ6_9STRA|nr:hypothetical protein PR002_g27591 [Phytophthora rubi]